MRTALAAVAAAATLGVLGAAVAHAYLARSAPPALPALHGQVTWAAGSRPMPATVKRGRTAVVAFIGRSCSGCLTELRFALRRLPTAARPALLLPPPSAAAAYGVRPRHWLILLVDRKGDARAGYTFPFAPSFVEGDLRTLAREEGR